MQHGGDHQTRHSQNSLPAPIRDGQANEVRGDARPDRVLNGIRSQAIENLQGEGCWGMPTTAGAAASRNEESSMRQLRNMANEPICRSDSVRDEFLRRREGLDSGKKELGSDGSSHGHEDRTAVRNRGVDARERCDTERAHLLEPKSPTTHPKGETAEWRGHVAWPLHSVAAAQVRLRASGERPGSGSGQGWCGAPSPVTSCPGRFSERQR